MKTYPWFLELTREAIRIPYYRPVIESLCQEAGIERMDAYLAQVALTVKPEPLRVSHLHQSAPYVNPAAIEADLAGAAERGVFTMLPSVVDSHDFHLTDKGEAIAHRIPPMTQEVAATLEPLPADDSQRLFEYLQQLVMASAAAPEPAEKEGLLRSRFFEPGPDAPIFERVRRQLMNLWLFRDDCHLASWRHYNVSGQAWEALTLLWRGEARTASELAEKLAHRRYGEAAYRAALQELAARGWLTEEDGAYRLTNTGRAAREEAERVTDRCFFGPWVILNEAELADLRRLMQTLRDNLHS